MILISPFRFRVLFFEIFFNVVFASSVLIFDLIQDFGISFPLGFYAAAYSLLGFILGRIERPKLQSWWLNTLVGLTGLLIAVSMFISPFFGIVDHTQFATVLLGIFSLVSGLLGISVLIDMKFELRVRGIFVLNTILSIILGVLMLVLHFTVTLPPKILPTVYGFSLGLTLIPGVYKLPFARR